MYHLFEIFYISYAKSLVNKNPYVNFFDKEIDSMSEAVDKKLIISCDTHVDISNVADIYQNLKKAFHDGRHVEIDASIIERIDTAVLQLFCAFIKKAESADLSVTWTSVSDSLRTSAELIGLASELNFPSQS